MKLKKIASLALAGIMAVSMLAGCKDGGNSNSGSSSENTNTSSNFTQTVLAKTSEYTRGILTVNNDENLDKAVAYVCDNSVVNSYQTDMKVVVGDTYYKELFANAKKYLPTTDYKWTDMEQWNFNNTGATEDETYVGMYVVGGKMTDEWIANELAKKIDSWVDGMNNDECKYSIKIVKGTCQNDDNVTAYETSTIVGVLVDIDNTTDNH